MNTYSNVKKQGWEIHTVVSDTSAGHTVSPTPSPTPPSARGTTAGCLSLRSFFVLWPVCLCVTTDTYCLCGI